MTPAEIRKEVIDILGDIAPDEELGDLADDKPFREQLELDSMDFLDIVMELRKRHRVQIPEEEHVCSWHLLVRKFLLQGVDVQSEVLLIDTLQMHVQLYFQVP